MKNQLLLNSYILVLGCFIFIGCGSAPTKSYYTTVMIDLTEDTGYQPSSDDIRPHAVLPEKSASKYFSILPINNRAHNQHNGVFVSRAEIGVFYDEMSRKIVIDDYYQLVDSLLLNIEGLVYGTHSSNIFRSVITEARFLMEQDCDKRSLVLYSDLEENSSFFSLQQRAHRKLMDDPIALRVFFESQFDIDASESFEGLEIKIYHQPEFEKERNFDVFLALYKAVFESRGAIVNHEVSTIISVEVGPAHNGH